MDGCGCCGYGNKNVSKNEQLQEQEKSMERGWKFRAEKKGRGQRKWEWREDEQEMAGTKMKLILKGLTHLSAHSLYIALGKFESLYVISCYLSVYM